MLAYDFEVDGIYYTITGSHVVSVVKGTYDYDGDITIPKTVSNGVETFSVTGIGEEAFKSATSLESVILPEGLTTIGNNAFYQSSIKTVSLPSTLSNMGSYAFYNCQNLTDIVLPDALKDVKEYSFSRCTSLKTMIFGGQTISIERYAFSETAIESILFPNTMRVIGEYAFDGCGSLKTLSINNARVSIEGRAFGNCINLKDVDLGNAIESLGTTDWYVSYDHQYGGAFYNCSSLVRINIPTSLTSIGDNSFDGCKSLREVTLPETIVSIGNGAFYGCVINEITLPSSLTSIGDGAFYSCPLTSIKFPSTLEVIGSQAFDQTALKEVTIPVSVKEINSYAFRNCKSLTKVKIEDAPVLLTAAFPGCTTLTDVDLGNAIIGLNSISDGGYYFGCFKGCTSLPSISIPNTIKCIGEATFCDCTKLVDVALPNALTSIGYQAFSNCSRLKTMSLPNTLKIIDHYAFYKCSAIQSIALPTSLTSVGTYAFSGCLSLNNIMIPEYVTDLGQDAFSDCLSLESVIFDNSVLSIQNYTFQNCKSLKNVELGKVTSISDYAFKNCTSLENVVVPNSVETMGNVFCGCSKLKSIIIGTGLKKLNGSEWGSDGMFSDCVKLSNVEIRSNVLTKIGANGFRNCRNLKKIELPASVTSISQNVFDGCSTLSHIYMNATTPPSIQSNTFTDYETPMLHVPSSAKTAYTKADNWKNFTHVIAIGSEPKATAEEVAALEALLTQALSLYNSSIEGAEPGNYRPGAKAAFKAIIDEVQDRIKDNMLTEDVEDCTELLETAMRSFKNKQVKNDIQTNNTLAFAGSLRAAIGSEFRLPIEMNNVDPITGVQFDLYLPEGMTLSEDEYGDYLIELSDRTTIRRHAVASRVMPDGALRVVVSSQQNAAFDGNNGTILTLVLFPKSTIEAGDHDVELKNIVLTDPDAKRYAAADMKSVITVSAYTMGDVNNDGYIDVADLAGVVRFILENADASLVFNAADMDGNGVVEINDYAALVNVILSQGASNATRQFRTKALRNVVIGLSDMNLNTLGEGEIKIRLDNNDLQYTGLQFDLRLPEGIELMDDGAEAMGSQHGAWTQKRADGTYRIICASMMNAELYEGDVLRLQVKVTGSVNGDVEAIVDNVVLSDVNATRHEAASVKASLNIDDATGIQDVGSKMEDGSYTIYNLAGQRIQKMQKGLYIVNGKKVAVK